MSPFVPRGSERIRGHKQEPTRSWRRNGVPQGHAAPWRWPGRHAGGAGGAGEGLGGQGLGSAGRIGLPRACKGGGEVAAARRRRAPSPPGRQRRLPPGVGAGCCSSWSWLIRSAAHAASGLSGLSGCPRERDDGRAQGLARCSHRRAGVHGDAASLLTAGASAASGRGGCGEGGDAPPVAVIRQRGTVPQRAGQRVDKRGWQGGGGSGSPEPEIPSSQHSAAVAASHRLL